MAMMPTKVDCSRMLSRMPICKKFGMVSENAASTMTRMIQTRLSRTNSSEARRRDRATAGGSPASAAEDMRDIPKAQRPHPEERAPEGREPRRTHHGGAWFEARRKRG